jgi:hypothetical protein
VACCKAAALPSPDRGEWLWVDGDKVGVQRAAELLLDRRRCSLSLLSSFASLLHSLTPANVHAMQDDFYLYLVMDYLDGGELFSLLVEVNTVPRV